MSGEKSARRIIALWPYARQWRLRIGFALAGLTIVSLSSLVHPWLLKLMVDRLSGRVDSPFNMTVLFSLLLLLFVIASVVGYYQQKEMKRVAIVRAIPHTPSIPILDEAKAGLEQDLEERLWRNLAGSRGDKTTITLSHHVEHIPEIYRTARLRNGQLQPEADHADSPLAPQTS